MTAESMIERIQSIYHSCSPDEQKILIQILQEIADTGESTTYRDIWLQDFKEIPVSIDEFICSPEYLGNTNRNGEAVYPFWRDTVREIFNAGNTYNEIILGGATRIGKTSTAIIIASYMLYRLMLYRDPHEYFKKKQVSKFTIAFANLTQDLAKGVAFREFNDTLKQSPWFNEHGQFSKSDRNFYYIPEGDKIDIIPASDAAHLLGMQLWTVIMDETNFSKAGIKDINIAKSHMKKLYDTVNARISGTFRLGGEVYGKLIASSSKNTDSDFLSDHIEAQLNSGNTHLYLVDKPQWEVLPREMFSDKVFHFTVGDRYKRGFVIPPENDDEAHLEEYRRQGFTVMEAPEEFRRNFLADYDISLRDIAGISVVGAMGFITQEAITPNISQTRVNPFYTDIISVGTRDNKTIEEFFKLDVVPKHLLSCLLNIHLDLSESGDRTGLGGVWVDGQKTVQDYSGKNVSLPYFREAFSVGVEPPRGDRLSFQKVMNFLMWLRRSGFNIGTISTDQYQSSYLRELLSAQGFNTAKISVDRSEEPYIGLKNILYDQRIELIHNSVRDDELVHLQRVNNKIDHPAGGCFTGDTKIRLVDGRSLTILDLLEEQKYRINWVYTVNEQTLKIEPKRIKRVFQTKITKRLCKVTLDNGHVICCTPEHRFMLRDGSFAEIQTLAPGDSLMPLYTKVSENGLVGYRMYYEPVEDAWHYEHRCFCLSATHKKGYVIHHCNYNRLDNTPTNLKEMSKGKHRAIHNNSTQDYSKTAESVRRWHKESRNSKKYAERSKKISEAIIAHNLGVCVSDIHNMLETDRAALSKDHLDKIRCIEEMFEVDWDQLSASERSGYGLKYSNSLDPEGTKARYLTALSKRTEESEERRKSAVSATIRRRRWYTNGEQTIYIDIDCTPPEGFYPGRTLSRSHIASIRSKKHVYTDGQRKRCSEWASSRVWVTNGVNDRYISKTEDIPDGYWRGRTYHGKNHKIVSIEYIDKVSKVYDLEIEDNHNFALDCGVFVHNSKDLSDCLAGACWTLTTEHAVSRPALSSVAAAIASVNKRKTKGTNSGFNMFPGLNTFKR